MAISNKKRQLDILVPIKETTLDASRLVRIDENVLKEMTDGDEHPEYVVVEFQEGKSNNNVMYDEKFFTHLAEQVNEKQPVGYLGHKHFQGLDKEDLLPDPQVVWLGATVSKENGKASLIAKGYLLPTSEGGKARGWIKRKAVNSVSWAGDAILTLGKDGAYRVKEYYLESIDFARKNKEGVKGQRLQVVTEMEKKKGDTSVGDDDRTTEEIVSKLVVKEIETMNPALATTLKEMGKDEVKDEKDTAVKEKEDELKAAHKKEIDEHPEITLMTKIRKLLGISDDDTETDPEAAIVKLIERLDDLGRQTVQNWFNTEILEKKVANEKARKLVGRLISVTEMEGDYRTETGIEKIKKTLEDKADDLIDNDDEIQTVIKEMGSTRGGVRLSGNREGERKRENNSDNNNDDGYKDTDNVRVERQKVGL